MYVQERGDAWKVSDVSMPVFVFIVFVMFSYYILFSCFYAFLEKSLKSERYEFFSLLSTRELSCYIDITLFLLLPHSPLHISLFPSPSLHCHLPLPTSDGITVQS